jgi:putative FmdB family regulatory protein
MPLYQYRCTSCGIQMEVQQRISEKSLTHCPNCETENLERVISAGGGFLLKGDGFYNTDYKNAKPKKSDTPVTEPATKPETKTETPAVHTCHSGCSHD